MTNKEQTIEERVEALEIKSIRIEVLEVRIAHLKERLDTVEQGTGHPPQIKEPFLKHKVRYTPKRAGLIKVSELAKRIGVVRMVIYRNLNILFPGLTGQVGITYLTDEQVEAVLEYRKSQADLRRIEGQEPYTDGGYKKPEKISKTS